MLESEDPPARIRALKADRQPGYALSHWTVHTDGMTPDEAAAEVIRSWRTLVDDGHRPEPVGEPHDAPDYGPDLASVVHTSEGRYPVWVGWDIIGGLGERAAKFVGPSTAFVIGDSGAREHAEHARISLENAGIAAHLYVMEAGEQNKTLQSANAIYQWLAEARAERKHLVVAVGGGMAGTWRDSSRRPTSEACHSRRYRQPSSPCSTLRSEARRRWICPTERTWSGHSTSPGSYCPTPARSRACLRASGRRAGPRGSRRGLILDRDLLDLFERSRDPIISLDPDQATAIIRRSVSIKGSVSLATRRKRSASGRC